MYAVRQGSGKPLLMVHGLGGSHRSWDRIVPTLAEQREVIAVDLPGFGRTPPLPGKATVAGLVDALAAFIEDEGLDGVDLVGSSMGARLVVELARRGHPGTVVALDPGGFWSKTQVTVFNVTTVLSVSMLRLIRPLLPKLTGSAIGRVLLLAQLTAHPRRLPAEHVFTELTGIATAPSFDDIRRDMAHGPEQQGAPAGSLAGRLVIGWGRQDRVTPRSQAARARELFPDATLHWFDSCGHFPQWDQPEQAAAMILTATAG